VLHAGRVTGAVTLPPAAYLHLLVVAGTVGVGAERLGPGDALRLAGTGATEITTDGAELLAWRMCSDLTSG